MVLKRSYIFETEEVVVYVFACFFQQASAFAGRPGRLGRGLGPVFAQRAGAVDLPRRNGPEHSQGERRPARGIPHRHPGHFRHQPCQQTLELLLKTFVKVFQEVISPYVSQNKELLIQALFLSVLAKTRFIQKPRNSILDKNSIAKG